MKIVFLSHFSNPTIRRFLNLEEYKIFNFIRRIVNKKPINSYDDFAIWVSDYISEFEKYSEHEFHIVAPHIGMKKRYQEFLVNGINYHFFKCDGGYIQNVINSRFLLNEKNDYSLNRKRIKSIFEKINPDIIILCGAENPHYATSVLDINNIPIYVILQTLLNDPKRIEMGVGSEYRRRIEKKIFSHAGYFSTISENEAKYIKECNESAKIFAVKFPTHRPDVALPYKKDYDFVFFARQITKNKGIEDLLLALAKVFKSYENVKCNIIGRIKDDYKEYLQNLIDTHGLQDNIHFSGYYEQIEDTYKNVVKSSVVVIPGITAALNSTVRESMLMGLPTICFESSATLDINKEKQCLLLAEMSDVDDLANKMLFTLENEEQTKQIALNGKEYADREFGNKSIVEKLLNNCKLISNQ